MEWFKEEWLQEDHKALGVYLALLCARFSQYLLRLVVSELDRYYSTLRKNIASVVYSFYKGKELKEVMEVIDEFIEEFTKNSPDNVEERKRILEEIEKNYYDRLKEVYQKHIMKEALEDVDITILQGFLWRLKAKLVEIRDFTQKNSVEISEGSIIYDIKSYEYLDYNKINTFIKRITDAHILIKLPPFTTIIPAPVLEDEFIESLSEIEEKTAKGVRIEPTVEFAVPKEKPEELIRLPPTREILEQITARVLRSLGFSVLTNVNRPARMGSSIEVDVWAEKWVGTTKFRVYVSCKNWDKDIDRRVIDEEFGRVFNLKEIPQMKIIIAKSLTSPAKEAAEADGFLVIETKEKANKNNSEDIYDLIYSQLSAVFTAIAPPKLLKMAEKVKDLAEELKKISDEMFEIAR